MNDENLRRHYRACNLCEAICGLEITLDANDNIVSIRGDEDDPLSRGYICPKAVALQDIYSDPNRLKQPVRRTANGWETITWNEAFDEVAERLKEIQSQHGKDSVGIFQGNPSVHNSGTLLSAPGLWRALGTKNRFSATSTDQLPHQFVAWAMFGHSFLLPVPDVDRTNYMLIIGGNPLASNGSLMTAPAMNRRLRSIRERGGKVVVVDPRRTETAKQADQHFFIKPATDVYFLLALLNVVSNKEEQNNLVDENDVARLRLLVEDYTPESVAEYTRLTAEDIRAIAEDLITAKSAVVYGRMGVSVQAFGGVCHWAINCLNILTGNFDRAGGAMFPTPAFDVLARAKRGANSFNRWQSKVRGLPEFDSELPSATLAEEIEHGEIKALITSAGNPVLSTPNGKSLETAFSKLDYMVSIDIYINETTRFANIILPPTTGLEVAHYDLVFHSLAIRNTAKYSEPLFEKDENQRHDWEIFQELTNRISGGNELRNPEEKIDMALRFGFYGKDGLSLAKLKEQPHGVDLGELRPCLPERLLTEDRRINLLPDLILRDLERVRDCLKKSSSDEFDLLLIGRRHLRSNNSWMHNTERLMKGRERCTLLIHPETAKKKGLTDKSVVRVGSRIGEVETILEFTTDIMPDVISLPHGFGHTRDGVQLDVATQYAGASINDLTDNTLIDELTGNAAFSGVPVCIRTEI